MDGIQCLHAQKIVHRDIKPANCFLSSKGEVRIGDLNVSKVIKDDKLMKTQIGTPYYMAPEMLRKQGHDGSVDVWQIGVLLYHMLVGRSPFQATLLGNLDRL